MAKFYVQSGTLRGIVDCYDAECAAVWAVNRVMEKLVAIPVVEECDELAQNDIGMFALDDSIRLSEIGFDRDDYDEIDTHLAFVQWHQLKKSIEAIEQRFDDRIDDIV
jgi:hypothetical protein